MLLQDVIVQALGDPEFAQELKDNAMLGLEAGLDTDEWETFMEYFAESPQQLATFRTLDDPNSACTATTGLTLTVLSGAACTFTTTTLTTSIFCEDANRSASE